MLLKIRHALLEITNAPNVKQSAIIINNEIVISSGCILQPYVRPINERHVDDLNIENVCASTKIIRKLQKCQMVNAQEKNSEEAQHLSSFSYQVTFDRRKLPPTAQSNNGGGITSQRRSTHILTRYSARVLYLFCSGEVSRNLHKSLSPINTGLSNDILLTSFVVLSLRTTNEKETLERFVVHIGNYLRYVSPVHTLDDVLVMCTPFGLENFYKTISIGKISNVMGRNGCLFALSNSLPLGCEGSAVFNNKFRLIGIIICTTFQRQEETVNLTLAANFGYLLRDFMHQLGAPVTSITIRREPSNFAWERTIVVVVAGSQQGTGTFIKVHNKKFILTCAHVLRETKDNVYCRGVDGEFETNVLWCNPEAERPFDVALLSAPPNTPERYCVRLASDKPSLGQTVYNAGFPYFINFNIVYDFNPSIFEGRIIKCDNGAIMSDGCVQAGQSGGPMFDQNGCILGICISNLKVDKTVYPNINTAVPIFDIRLTLENYAKTNDVDVLNNLLADEEIQRVWSLEIPPIQSKL